MKESMKRITDLQLAAWLISEGYAVKRLEGSASQREFWFDVDQETVLRYYSDECTASPRKLFNAYRDARALVHQMA